MATPTLYKSTDASAPVLTGEVSKLIDLLDAVLVNGYGAKAAAGWTKPFTGTDKAAFRNSTAGTGTYVRVVDDNAQFGSLATAELWGYSTMSDVDTGTDQFPTAANISTDPDQRKLITKSVTTDSTARSWAALATNRWIILSIEHGDQQQRSCYTYFIGDFPSFLASDSDNFLLGAANFVNNTSPGSTSPWGQPYVFESELPGSSVAPTAGYFGGAKKDARGGVVGSDVPPLVLQPVSRSTGISGGTTMPDYPHPDYGLALAEIYLGDLFSSNDKIIRGKMPNLLYVGVDLERDSVGMPFSNFEEITVNDTELGSIECIYLGFSYRYNWNNSSGAGVLFGVINQDDGL